MLRRLPLVFSCVALLCGHVPAADAPPATAAAKAQTPLAKRLAWYKRVTIDAYESAGQKDPNWDDAARQCIQAFCRFLGPPGTVRNGDEEDLIWLNGQKALNAGCRDPLVTYAMARNLTLRTHNPARLRNSHCDAADRFRDSKYPAFVKALAYLRAAQYAGAAAEGDEAAGKRAAAYVDAAVAALPEAFADPNFPAYDLFELFRAAVEAKPAAGGDAAAIGDKVMAALEKSNLPRSVVLTGKGDYYLQYAWDARGSGFANTVTRRGGDLFAERIGIARQALEEAWKLDPSNAEAANAMLIVVKAQGRDPKLMQQWYKRAIAADPDSYRAAARKMEALEPKWGGSAEQMIGFGRELLAGGNFDAGLPLQLVDAHWTLSNYTNLGTSTLPDPGYFSGNAAQAWKDTRAVYDAYLSRAPDSRYHRTRYALIAAWCGQWAEADRQFKKLGESFSGRAVTDQMYRQAREQAAAHAGEAAQTAEEKRPADKPAQKRATPAAPALPF